MNDSADRDLSLYRAMFLNSPVPVFILDTDFHYLEVNQAFEDLFGYCSSEIFQKAGDFLFADSGKLFDIRDTLSREKVFRQEIRKRNKNGEVLYVDLSIFPAKNEQEQITAYVGIGKEITEKVQLRNRLKEQETLFRTLTEHSLAGIFLYREKFVYVNPIFEEISGYSQEELLNLTPWELFHPENQTQAKDFFEREIWDSREKDSYRELKVMSKHGEEKWLYVAATKIAYQEVPAVLVNAMDITSMKFLQQQMEKLAITDYLTGAYNRVTFEDRIRQEVKRAVRYQKPLSLIIFDIDFFKDVNDSFGHEAGDRVLVEVAKIVQKNIRKIDFFARYGGEEFVILAPDTDIVGAIGVAERIRQEIETTPLDIVGKVTISAGVSQLKDYDQTESEFLILKMADDALYRAKRQGRNQVLAW